MKKTKVFPRKIGKYKYFKDIKADTVSSYKFAYYKDAEGNLYFCKLWSGTILSLKYRWIVNEINAYKLLNRIYDKNSRSLKEKFPLIKIPKLVGSYNSKNKTYLLVEHIKGEHIDGKPIAEIQVYYQKIYNFLQLFTSYVDLGKANIIKRSVSDYFLLFQYYFLLAIFFNPRLIITLLKGTPMFYLGLLKMKKDNKESLVMRDIASDNNVFINNTTLTLIDFENLTITNSVVQIVNILIGKCYDRDFINLFLQSKQVSEIKRNKHKLSIFRSMLFYGAIVEIVEAKREKRGLPYEFPVELLNISLSPKLKRNNKSGLSFNNVFNLFDGYKFMKGVLINNE